MVEWKETELGKIPNDWDFLSVGDLVKQNIIDKPLDGNHGGNHPKGTDFVDTGVPFIMATDINNGNIDLVNCKFITKEQADSLNKGFAITDDVLLTHKASLGRTAIVGKIETPYIMLTPQVTFYRVNNKNKLNNIYLKYFFDSPTFQGILMNHGDSGSTRAYVGITAQRDLPICLPPISVQKAIASVLSSLDDKIDLLHRQNKTLEAMAETLFRQWFVEEAQEDWEEKPLSRIAEHKKINVRPDQNPGTIYRHYSIPAFDDGKHPIKELGSEIKSNKYQVLVNSILISKLNPRFPRVWAISDLLDDNSICSTEFQVVLPVKSEYYGFIYCFLKSKQVTGELIGAAGGTSGSHQRVKPEDIFNLKLQMPSQQKIDDFNSITSENWKRMTNNMKQIRTLEKLRDTLLPKLMSGEVRVKYDN